MRNVEVEIRKIIATKSWLSNWLDVVNYGIKDTDLDISIHNSTPQDLIDKAEQTNKHWADVYADIMLGGGSVCVSDASGDHPDRKVAIDDIVEGIVILILQYPEAYADLRMGSGELDDGEYESATAVALLHAAAYKEIDYKLEWKWED